LRGVASKLDTAEGILVDRSAKLIPGSRAEASTSSKESSAKRASSSDPIPYRDSSVRERTTGLGVVLVKPGDSSLTGTTGFIGLGGLTGVALEVDATLGLEIFDCRGAGAGGGAIGR